MARPTNLDDPGTLDRILAHIRSGVPIDIAAGAEGVAAGTVRARMSRNPEFAREITRARDSGQIALLKRVQGGDGPGQGFGPAKAALEVLQRVNPKQFAQRVNVKVEEELSEFLEVASRVLDAGTYELLLREYSKRQNGLDAIGLGEGSDSGEESEEGSA